MSRLFKVSCNGVTIKNYLTKREVADEISYQCSLTPLVFPLIVTEVTDRRERGRRFEDRIRNA